MIGVFTQLGFNAYVLRKKEGCNLLSAVVFYIDFRITLKLVSNEMWYNLGCRNGVNKFTNKIS